MNFWCKLLGHKVQIGRKGEILCSRCKTVPQSLGIDLLREYINSGHAVVDAIPEECKHEFRIVSIDPRDAITGILTSGTKFSTCVKCGYYPTNV